MSMLPFAAMTAVLLCSGQAALAQTTTSSSYTILGEVEDVRNTIGQFYLDCTEIPVTSTAVDLNFLQAQPGVFELTVTDIGTPGQPLLRVDNAVPALRTHDMGNLRIGRAERWEVLGAPGSYAITHGQLTRQTRWQPISGFGVFLLGANSIPVHRGFIGPFGRLEFNFTMPNVPALVGTEFTSQSLVLSPNGTGQFTNADCKEVRN